MSDLFQKVKLWYSLVKMSHTSYARVGIHPSNDWRILLIITSIILFLGAFVAFYFYTQISQEKLFATNKDSAISEVIINKDLLEKTVGEINLREASSEAIKQGKISQPDPSL